MSELTDAVICEPLRTPVGRYGGVFRNVPAEQLAATVIRGLLKRTGLDRLLPLLITARVTGPWAAIWPAIGTPGRMPAG